MGNGSCWFHPVISRPDTSLAPLCERDYGRGGGENAKLAVFCWMPRRVRSSARSSLRRVRTSYGLTSPVLGDYENDQIDDVAFAGDLVGNLWRFDLKDPDPAKWTVSLAYQPSAVGNATTARPD